MYVLRFDMRAPATSAASIAELYRAAVDMVAWGEANGCVSAMVSEHHSSSDNYLPSPLVLAAGFATRTRTLPIAIGAILLNMYDPVKLAEDMAVLDILSEGRVSYIIGLGYRAEEYAMFGVSMANRTAVIEEKIQALLQALSGQQFVYQGRNVQVTPTPRAARGIAIAYGGHSKAAARAGRFGLDFYANGGSPELVDIYTQAALSAGKAVGNAIVPAPDSAQCVFVAQNLDRAWNEIGPYMLHDIKMYRQWEGEDSTAVTSYATNIDEIREESGPYRIVTPDQALEMITTTGPLMMSPLVGGCPPQHGWASLHLLAEKVLPRLAAR
ncbi:MAG: LLM class flavin-dependent oxidoreductase [Gammaproteobacteria bacterium]|nr:LLM class flavin-dependent oxidoreductase [Gammaproteobacteria bacterium]